MNSSPITHHSSLFLCFLLTAVCLLTLACGPQSAETRPSGSVQQMMPIEGDPIDPCNGNACAPPKATPSPSPTPTPEFNCSPQIVDGKKVIVCE
jgi:hypothetical protein